MASATANWKRPWQDDDRNQSGQFETPGFSQGKPDNPRASPFRSEKEDVYNQGKQVSQGPRSLLGAKDEHPAAYTQGVPRDSINGGPHQHPSLQPSLAVPSKRARLDTSPMQERRHEPGFGPRAFSQHAPHRPTEQVGYLEPRISDDPPRGEMSRRQEFMSLVAPSPYEPSTAQRPRDMPDTNCSRNTAREEARRDCPVCEKAQSIAPHLASGLQGLHKQLRHVLDRGKAGSTPEVSTRLLKLKIADVLTSMQGVPSPRESTQPPPERLIETLDYSIDRLNENMRLAQDILHNLTLEDRSPTNAMGGHSAYGDKARARWEQGDRLTAQTSQSSPRGSDEGQRTYDQASSLAGRDERPSHHKESTYQAGSYGTHLGRPNSPGGGRTLPALPSPPGIKFTTSAGILPPMSPSVTGPNGQSAHIAHLQDLQHQLSTKSLAHQILQGEHEKLLAAYSRSQTRCNSLDKKSQVSDAEINNLSEDRQRLQSQIEMFEQQVEELQASRDEAHKQSVANGAQYMQIMAMSSKLQAQSASDLKKWKGDREEWASEKDELLKRIEKMEKEAGHLLKHDFSHGASEAAPLRNESGNNDSSEGTAAPDHGQMEKEEAEEELSSMSLERLKEEVLSLRRSKREAQSLVQAFRDESGAIRKIAEELGSMGERLVRIGGEAREAV